MKKYIALVIQALSFSTLATDKINYDEFLDGSMEGLKMQTQAHLETWGIGKAEQWNVDQEKGIIYWTFKDGKIATAPVQIIGTYNPTDGTFLWSWDHPSVVKPLQVSASVVKGFGQKHGFEQLMTRKVSVTEDEAWGFVAIANRLSESNGGYRGDTGGPLVFMTYGTITLQQNPQ